MKLIFLLSCLLLGQMQCKPSDAGVATVHEEVRDTLPLEAIVTRDGQEISRIIKSDSEWREILDDKQFYVLRKKGTERPFTSPLNNNKQKGNYACAACGTVLFTSEKKFDSGTGWPSFFLPADDNLIDEDTDYDLGYARTEVLCAVCRGHLGHVFEDGPPPSGLRYCINGVSLQFIPEE